MSPRGAYIREAKRASSAAGKLSWPCCGALMRLAVRSSSYRYRSAYHLACDAEAKESVGGRLRGVRKGTDGEGFEVSTSSGGGGELPRLPAWRESGQAAGGTRA